MGDFSSKGQIVVDDFESTALIPENSPPGTRISEFQIIVYNFHILQITITSVPKSKFFQVRWRKTDEINSRNIFRAEIFLNTYVSLDYEKTPTYLLTISIFAENTDTQMKQLWLYVLNVRCGVQFQTPGGATVRVLETAEPLSQIYTIVSAPTYSWNFTYTITESVPESARDHFSVDRSGTIHVPLNGFGRYNEERNFKLHITVTANLKTICTGSVTILVIPVPYQTPVFTSVPQSISIPENQGPEFYVTTVRATGDRVRYHLASFNPSFHIGEGKYLLALWCNGKDEEHYLEFNLLPSEGTCLGWYSMYFSDSWEAHNLSHRGRGIKKKGTEDQSERKEL
ncbi:uncharacterized protein [Narcine bancroftii]|uniref:uncharacterized protein n=1 Tax=Narcine bancroftii TaxID=1343680 RepID=UPI003831411A